MKKYRNRMAVLLAAAPVAVLAMLLFYVPAYADIAYDPIERYGDALSPLILFLVIGSAAVSLIAGIVLLIVFSVRRKRRRAAQEQNRGQNG